MARNTLIFSLIYLMLLLTACGNKKKTETPEPVDISFHQIVVKKVIQEKDKTLMLADENGKEYWICTTKTEADTGDVFVYSSSDINPDAMHQCEALIGQSDKVLMIDKVIDQHKKAVTKPHSYPDNPMPSNHSGGRVITSKIGEKVPTQNGSISIAEVFQNKETLAGKKVKIRGKVTKVNRQIMGRNWVHLQDGTSFGNEFDLTVTTQQEVEVDDVILFDGVISINKDFTAGYFYPVIMEDAKIIN